jgi:hypothetical protein
MASSREEAFDGKERLKAGKRGGNGLTNSDHPKTSVEK